MTSGSLFFKLIGKDLKQRIWCPVLLFVTFFLSMEVTCLIQFQNIDAYEKASVQSKLSFFRDNFLMLDSLGGAICFLMIGSAVLCGLSSFTYLSSKKQIDLYHSLPIHRSTIFFSRFLAGILCFVIPFLFHTAVTFLIAASEGAVDGVVCGRIFIFAGVQIVYFLSIYATTVLAVMLTGNLVMNAIGSVVLLAYSPILSMTVRLMNHTFFSTFSDRFYKRYMCLSPLQDLVECILAIDEKRSVEMLASYAPVMKSILWEGVAVIVLVWIEWRLFLKRPSETAGKSIVFPIAESIIKTLFLIPVSLACGVFFRSASSDSHMFAWFLFGAIFSFFFIGIVIEIIYRIDIKAGLCHWKYLLLNFAAMLGIIAIYKLDLFGYDRYLPNKEHLESMAISIPNLDTQINGYGYDEGYTEPTTYRLTHMKLKETDAPYLLCKMAIEEPISYQGNWTEEDEFATTSEYMEYRKKNPDNGYNWITVAYNLKNGKQIYREYVIDMLDEKQFALLDQIYKTEDYKKVVFPLLTDTQKTYFRADCTEAFEIMPLKTDGNSMEEFLKLYREDLRKLSLQEVCQTLPLGSIDLYERQSDYVKGYYGYPLYPSFTNTISWLKEQGIDYTKEPEEGKIISALITNYHQAYQSENGYETWAEVLYEDAESLKEIMRHCGCDFSMNTAYLAPLETWLEIRVTFETNGVVDYRTFYFKKDEIPEFVIQDLDAFVPTTEQ